MLSLCVLGVAISTASARNYLYLSEVINETNKPLTIMIKTGGEFGGDVYAFDVAANSHYEVKAGVDIADVTNARQYTRVIDRSETESSKYKVSPEVEFTTQWREGFAAIGNNYHITQRNESYGKFMVPIFRETAYAKLIVNHRDGEFVYTWRP